MKIFTVGNKSFVTSFQLAGVPGIISETPQHALDEIKKLTDDSDVGLVLVSDDITKSIDDELTALRAKKSTLVFGIAVAEGYSTARAILFTRLGMIRSSDRAPTGRGLMIFDRYRFNEQVAMELGEKILLAIVALIVTWLTARAAKWAFAKLVDAVDFFKRGTGSGQSLGESLGKIVSLLIWLFGLLIILNILELGGVAGPIDSLLENVVAFLPNLLWAGLIFFIGMMVARIVRDLVVTTLQTADLDKWANRGGVDSVTGNSTISRTIGTIVYVLIAIPVAIAALEGPQDSVAAMMEEFTKRRDLVVEGLNSLPGITCPVPKGAFYAFPNIRGTGMSSQEFANKALYEAGVALLAGTAFGAFGDGYIRISFANSQENLLEAIERLRKIL